jgi:hypothetical protein
MVGEKTRLDTAARGAGLTVTNAVWIAVAFLQKRHPERGGFSVDEISGLVAELDLTDGEDKSVRQHVRLYRGGDEVYPGRNAARTHPKWEELPPQYEYLRRWYEEEWIGEGSSAAEDPLLALIGSGKEIWKSEHADEYVKRLRSGWGDRG